jgi:hypothetical protein
MLNNKIVWGATALMLNEVRMMLGWFVFKDSISRTPK